MNRMCAGALDVRASGIVVVRDWSSAAYPLAAAAKQQSNNKLWYKKLKSGLRQRSLRYSAARTRDS